MWALERQPADERDTWANNLNNPLPGESLDAAMANFDDSYDQINQ